MQMQRREAAGKVAGTLSYVLSDATRDRYGDVIDPDGWLLDHFRQNPIALFNHSPHQPIGKWKNIRVEDDRLLADFVPAIKGTSQRTDEILSLIDQDILRATSVGFRPLTQEPLDPKRPMDGTRFTSQELLETSIVSVPANPAALQIAKSLNISDDTLSVVFAGSGGFEQRDMTTRGGHARQQSPTSGISMNIAQQIEDVQTRLNTARDALLAHVENADHDADQAQQYNDQIEYLEKDLASKQRTERSLAVRAAEQTAQLPAVRRPLGTPTQAVPKHDYIWRAAAAQFYAVAKRKTIEDAIRERYPLERYPDAEAIGWVTRAAVSGALTSVPSWAGDLLQQGTAEWLATLTPAPVFSQAAASGTALNFGAEQGSIKVPSRTATPSISGAFVGEAQPIPVRRLGLTSIVLSPYKMGGIAVFSREMAAYSNPSIEGIIRDAIQEDTSLTIDTLFLDATAGSTIRPAGIRFGISATTASTLGGYAAVLADIAALTAPFYAVNAGRTLVMIVNPQQSMQLGFAPGPDGTFGWAAQFTQRFKIIESTTVTPGTVIVLDAADLVTVYGGFEFDISEQATLHMEDTTPLHIGTAGAPATIAAPTQSLWQSAQIGIRMLLTISWAMRRAGMVTYMTGASWAPKP